MRYTHDISRAKNVAAERYEVHWQKAQEAIGVLKKHQETGNWPLLNLPVRRDDLTVIETTAKHISEHFATLIVVGMGGSSLGGRALVALKENPFAAARPHIHFIDNIDPVTSDQLLASLDVKTTFFLFISKSGDTAETLAHALIILGKMEKVLGKHAIRHQVLFITEPRENALSRLAKIHHIPLLDHDPSIGGRYAALSVVGLLPAAVAGCNIYALREGANAVLEQLYSQSHPYPAQGAALCVALAEQGKSLAVVIPYCDRLNAFGNWHRQLVAESLGKNGKGITPLRDLGASDKHSQLQLYLDGPRDKWITLILLAQAGRGSLISANPDAAISYLSNHTLGDLMEAEQQATLQTLAKNGCPLRLFTLSELDEKAMGGLMMHYMLEVIIAAHIMGVNAFDQPAVEEGKRLTREYMEAMP